MPRLRPSPILTIRSLILSVLLAVVPGAVSAQSSAAGIPAHASAKSYGNGWVCDRGYREVGGTCVAVRLPANAYATDTSYGQGWECRRGYQEVDKRCTAIAVPRNAFLNSSGDWWQCERGYREAASACLAIKVPANGYLTESTFGSGWTCERGHQAVEETCIAVRVPENAHLDYSGTDWDCDRPYRKKGDRCFLP